SQFRIALVVAGTAAQVEVALGAPIGRFVHGGRTYHAPLADPSLPESIAASVRGVVGLDDLPKFRPLAAFPGSQTALVPSDFAAAYGVAPLQAAGLTGAGHSIAVVARSNFADTDVALFSSNFLSFQLAPVRVFPGADPGILAEEGERIEVLLDTQWAGSLAPGATLDVVIGSPHGDIPEALIAAIENRAGDRVSLSAGLAGLSSGRALPDLAVAASPVDPGYVIVEGGLGRIVGGTSAGTPALASALALVNQRLAQTRGVTGGLGQLLPDLYRLGSAQA